MFRSIRFVSLSLYLFLFTFTAASAFADSASVSVGGGTLSYTATFSTGNCFDGAPTSYSQWNFSNFSYVDQNGASWAGSGGGGGTYIQSPGGSCPPNGPQPVSDSVPVVNGTGFTINFHPCNGAVCSADISGRAQVPGIMPPIGQAIQQTSAGTNGILYHGGPIIVTPHVYFIWYGNWAGNTGLAILPQFIAGLNDSAYFDTNTTYTDGTGQNVVNDVTAGPQVFDQYSQGTTLSDSGLQTVILKQLQAGTLPTDSNGIYFVLTSADVDEQAFGEEFCVQFCGYHNHATLNGADIKYAFVGNIDRCPRACAAPNLGPGPNGNPGVDAMANVMAHELNETATDPDLNAWIDSNGQEVGDKCNFNFGPEFTTPNGAPANVTLAGRNFLIQQNWVNFNGGFCGLSVGTPSPLNGAFVEQQYVDFLDRAATLSEFNSGVNAVNAGTSRAAFITQTIFPSQEFGAKGKFVAQAFRGLLVREADYAGFRNALNSLDSGRAQVDLAQQFITSQEFQANFGSNLTNQQFVTVMYQNVLLRQPDQGGLDFWTSQLNNGGSRAAVALAFLQSQEFMNLTATQNRVAISLLYFDMLRRDPDSGGFNFWLNQLNTGIPLVNVVNAFLTSAEYAARF